MKDRVKNNSASQMGSAIVMDGDSSITEFRSKVLAHYAVPAWDGESQFIEVMKSLNMNDEQISAAVAAARRKSGLVAPDCSFAIMVDYISEHHGVEFNNLVGTPVNEVPTQQLWSVSFDREYIARVADDATPSQILSALLSYRYHLELVRKLKRDEMKRYSAFYQSIYTLCNNARLLGVELENVLRRVKSAYADALTKEQHDTDNLRDNFLKYRTRMDAALSDLSLCYPDAVCWWSGKPHLMADRLPKSASAKAHKTFAVVRRCQSAITDLNRALFGV